MKRLLLIVLPLLLIVGCSSPEPINYETALIERDGVFYTKDTNKPYSGPGIHIYDEWWKTKSEGIFKDGEKDGLWTSWYENGQKDEEVVYKDGEEHGLVTNWYENGQKSEKITMRYGKLDGLYKRWHRNGKKWSEGVFKDGERDGLWNRWHDNGQKWSEQTYKDGELNFSKCWDEDGNEKECF